MSKMFRLMLVCLISLFVTYGSAMAFSENGYVYDKAVANGTYDAEAVNKDMSYDHEYDWFGGGSAFSFGEVMVGGEMTTHAGSVDTGFYCWKIPAFAYQTGTIFAMSDGKTWAWVDNDPFKVKAVAGAKFVDGGVLMYGLALGNGGSREEIESRVKYGAKLIQFHNVEKGVWGAGYVFAGNMSGLNFKAYMPSEYDSGKGFVTQVNGTSYTPDVVTVGKSEVRIDPFGSVRSISAHTQNMSQVVFSPCHRPETLTSNVYGAGIVGGQIGIGNNYAGGASSFMYNGYTTGRGEANLNAVVGNVGTSSFATVTGSSWATTNGVPTNNCCDNGNTPR
jgi:hypothetical protein